MVGRLKAFSRRAIGQRADGWFLLTMVVAFVLAGPILAVFAAATQSSEDLWSHLASTVLPRYVFNTLILVVGVSVVAVVFGVSTAWIVSRYDFPGVSLLRWMLLLPAAAPAYIVAYAYVDFFEFAGPVQGALREIFGWRSARDYWFPEIRSMGGAIVVIGSVLYPYVYMMARTSFVQTPVSLCDVAAIANRRVLWSVTLPLARPAIAAGLALVMMETISDFGTVEFFAVETLTLGIFNVWLGMNSLPAAAQIASLCFLFIIALLVLEYVARAKRRFVGGERRSAMLRVKKVFGFQAVICQTICLLPIFIGFVIPVSILVDLAASQDLPPWRGSLASATSNSLVLSLIVSLCVAAIAVVLVIGSRHHFGRISRLIITFASSGYAFPGVILAIGVLTFAGYFDGLLRSVLGFGGLSAGYGLVVFACVVRFQAVGTGALMAGMERIPGNLVNASRTLGRSFNDSIRVIVLPLLSRSLVACGLFVFVDTMKELPMTLLLRPFNFETLPTFVYQYAKDELLEEAAVPALAIIAVGVLPVIAMNFVLNKVSAKT